MWIARQVAAFLCVDTGSLRDLDHILKRMRFTVILQLRHCKHRAADEWTVEPAPPTESTLQKGLAHLHAVQSRFQV